MGCQNAHRGPRGIHPRFGDQDAEMLIDILEEKESYYKVATDPVGPHVKTPPPMTPCMLRNFELFGDILLIDSTYRVNHYNIPLVAHPGIDGPGQNILFGPPIIPNGASAIHEWCPKEFFEVHKKLPQVVVADQDLALMDVLDKSYPEITHLLCQWHIGQNIKKHPPFLSNINLGAIYGGINSLIHIQDKKLFEDLCANIETSLKLKNYSKSAQYFQRLSSLKKKWATCYLPDIFTAGIHTTSRVESINAVIKKYVNSGSEVIDILDSLAPFEKKNAPIKKGSKAEKKAHPLLEAIRKDISEYIFNLHYEQFDLCFRYILDKDSLALLNMQSQNGVFNVSSIDAKDPPKFRVAKPIKNRYVTKKFGVWWVQKNPTSIPPNPTEVLKCGGCLLISLMQ